MQLQKLGIANQAELQKIIEIKGLSLENCEFDAYYRPDALLYDSTLVIVLTDEMQEIIVEIASYYQNILNKNLGVQVIGADFSKDFISELNSFVADRVST